MALTMTRWIGGASAVCALLALNAIGREPTPRTQPEVPADSLRLRDLQRRVGEASLRWEALVRRDAVLAQIASARSADRAGPAIIVDPLLPATHRSILERAIQRQWSSLGIDSARVPVTVAVIVDTAVSIDRLSAGRGQISHDYVVPRSDAGTTGESCVAIIGLQSRTIVRPGTERALAAAVALPRAAASLVGPCGFVGRFGSPGEGIDRWLRARGYRFAAHPQWWTLPPTNADLGTRWQLANAGAPHASSTLALSPQGRGCAAGHAELCAGALGASDSAGAGELLMMLRARDEHWGSMSGRYFADLATALGPERFETFWRSDLPPDAALRAVASTSLDLWTHQWAVGLVGAQRDGPGVSLAEWIKSLTLAGLSLGIAAWGWSRRQVR